MISASMPEAPSPEYPTMLHALLPILILGTLRAPTRQDSLLWFAGQFTANDTDLIEFVKADE